jgi:hypothetical protein
MSDTFSMLFHCVTKLLKSYLGVVYRESQIIATYITRRQAVGQFRFADSKQDSGYCGTARKSASTNTRIGGGRPTFASPHSSRFSKGEHHGRWHQATFLIR